ncbi:hypothetical protein Tco_0673825 [Tanacetum coccineum]
MSCYYPITLDNLGKFDGKSDEGFFVGYSLSSKAFKGLQGVSEICQFQQDQKCLYDNFERDASYFGNDAPRSVEDSSLKDNRFLGYIWKEVSLGTSYMSFAVFLSQEEHKKEFLTLLCDPEWEKPMQEELLIEKEVYVCQPPGFEDPDYPNKVYKDLEKPLVKMGDCCDVDEYIFIDYDRVLMYLTASGNIMLQLSMCEESPLKLVAYTDSDYAGE